jgi:hypothetical protein
MNNNTKNNNVPIKIENIMNFDFKNDQFDTYISWIETPEVELFVINELIKKSIKTTYIIAYSSEQIVCNNCNLCDYLKCIPNKKEKLINFLDISSKNNYINYTTETYAYNEGIKCRQSGSVTYYIVNII